MKWIAHDKTGKDRLDSAFVVLDKKTEVAVKTFPYSAIKNMEYSYSNSPRWKTAILVSPLFLFTSGKKHWR